MADANGRPAARWGEAAGTITIEVAAKLLMVTPEWVRRLTKDGWIAKTDRGRYPWSMSCLASAMRPTQVASDAAP